MYQVRVLEYITGVLIAVAVVFSPLRAYGSTYFTFGDGSQVVIEGSSTVRDWACRGPDVRGYLRIEVGRNRIRQALNTVHELMVNRQSADWKKLALSVPLRVSGPPRARAAIPVRSMDCGNSAMNEDMYEALKVNRQSALLYELYRVEKATVRSLVSARDGVEYELQTTGAMAIAGMAKTVELTLVSHQVGSDTFHVQGRKELKMSDFDITPPTAFFGLIKAYDPITIRFDLTMVMKRSPGPPRVQLDDRELRDMDYGDWLK